MGRRKLTDAEKHINKLAGLTPSGQLPLTSKERDAAQRAEALGFDPSDYRCQGLEFTPHRKNHYLRTLRETGEHALARAEVGVSAATVKEHIESDSLFHDAVAEALRQHAAVYTREMYRRAVEGVDEPVFGSQGPMMGSGIVGHRRRYSDALLVKLAERFEPEFTPRQKVEQVVQARVEPLGLDKLSKEARRKLREVLEEAGGDPEGAGT